MSGRRAQTDAQAEEGPTRGRRRRRGEEAQEEGRVEWRQFATKIQMNDEKSRERVSPSGIGMGARIPTCFFGHSWHRLFYTFLFLHVLRVHLGRSRISEDILANGEREPSPHDGPFPGRRGRSRSRFVPSRRRRERQTRTTTKWGNRRN